MFRSLTAAVCVATCAGLLAAAPAPVDSDPVYIDLAPHVNVKLTDNFHSIQFSENNLGNLPTGKQTFAGVKFNVGKGLIQLKSAKMPEMPAKVEGIKVGRFPLKVHFLHACAYQATEEALIGKYVVHYEDKTTADIEIVYGKDVVDWWVKAGQQAPTRGKVAWEGENVAAKGQEAKIKLYLTTWENPNPKKKVVSIDYLATAPEGEPAPFCVAITAEEK